MMNQSHESDPETQGNRISFQFKITELAFAFAGIVVGPHRPAEGLAHVAHSAPEEGRFVILRDMAICGFYEVHNAYSLHLRWIMFW